MNSRIRTPFIFFLNPVYVAARSLRSLRSNYVVTLLLENKRSSPKLVLFLIYLRNLGGMTIELQIKGWSLKATAKSYLGGEFFLANRNVCPMSGR